MREKLIELICSTEYGNGSLIGNNFQKGFIEKIADHLIANGVTFGEDINVPSKWIPVSERLPENDYGTHWKERPHYLVLLRNGLMRVATFGYKEYGWWIDSHNCVLESKHYTEVTHWMPLPEPPKEDE